MQAELNSARWADDAECGKAAAVSDSQPIVERTAFQSFRSKFGLKNLNSGNVGS
jgi:hypothetical protein